MQMPEPDEHHQILARLAGDWTGPEILHPSPWSPVRRDASGRFCNRMGVDGMFLINDYEQQREGHVVFRGHGVYGWDARRERFTMYWFDSMGFDPSETLGVWDGETLTFRNQSEQGHSRYVYRVHGADRFEFRIESSSDGDDWQCLMEGDYRRV